MIKKIFIFFILFIIFLSNCKKETKKDIKNKIGIVFDVGGRGDKSFNDSAYNGLLEIAKEYKGYIKDDPDNVNYGNEVELKYLEPKQGGQDREQLLRVLAEDGYNLIMGIGFMFSDHISKVAKDFPDVHFTLIDGNIPNLTEKSNINCITFSEQEGSFLVGAIAGLLTKTNKIGFIGGMDIPLIHKFQGGYIAGAMYVNTNLRKKGTILAQYIGKDPLAFNDAPQAYNIASSMYKQDVDIIYHAAGASGAGLFQASEEFKRYAIGVDSDQGLIYATSNDPATVNRSKYIITSMLKKVNTAVFLSAKEIIETGKIKGGYTIFGLKEDGVNYALNEFNKDLINPIKDQIESIKQKIINKEIEVPYDDSEIEKWSVKNLK